MQWQGHVKYAEAGGVMCSGWGLHARWGGGMHAAKGTGRMAAGRQAVGDRRCCHQLTMADRMLVHVYLFPSASTAASASVWLSKLTSPQPLLTVDPCVHSKRHTGHNSTPVGYNRLLLSVAMENNNNATHVYC